MATLGLHLGFSAKLRIWQVSACKMEPRSGIISWFGPPPTNIEVLSPIPTLKIYTNTSFITSHLLINFSKFTLAFIVHGKVIGKLR